MPDMPLDYKIENDRLIYELEPIARRMSELIRGLPNNSKTMKIYYDGFIVEITTKDYNE